MKATRYLLLVVIMFFSLTTLAKKENDISLKLDQYFSALANEKGAEAADLVYPQDLIDMKKYMLPVFIEGLNSENEQAREFAEVLLNEMPEGEFEAVSAKEFYILYNKFLEVLRPGMFSLFKNATLDVDEVRFDKGGHATIYYSVLINGSRVSDKERFTSLDGSWYIRTKGHPKEIAKKFEKIFGNEQ